MKLEKNMYMRFFGKNKDMIQVMNPFAIKIV